MRKSSVGAVLAHAEKARSAASCLGQKSEPDKERNSRPAAVGKVRRLLGLPRRQARSSDPSMRSCLYIRNIAAAFLLWAALSHSALATGAEPAKDVQADP